MRFHICPSIVCLVWIGLTITATIPDVFSQPPDRGGSGSRGRRENNSGGSGSPQTAGPTATEPATPITFKESLRLGTPPDFTGLTDSAPLSAVQLFDTPGAGPILPVKAVRYTSWFIEKNDTNGDGVLQREEWEHLSPAPQSIDLDGDGTITLDEVLRHVARYAAKRTYHRPNPPPSALATATPEHSWNLFRPLSAPLPPPKTSPTSAQTSGNGTRGVSSTENNRQSDDSAVATVSDDGREDVTDEIIQSEEGGSAAEDEDEDISFEAVLTQTGARTMKKYYSRPELLKGLPAWAISRDKNGDGQLSLVEFAPNLSPESLALFGKIDQNGDGLLVPDEIRRHLQPTR